jgi:hypothetical protein
MTFGHQAYGLGAKGGLRIAGTNTLPLDGEGNTAPKKTRKPGCDRDLVFFETDWAWFCPAIQVTWGVI